MTKKMTMRNTVTEIINYLADCARAIGKLDKNLYQRMAYTSKALKNGEKVAKKDLLDLANECFTVMAAADEAKPKKEASAKPAPKKSPAKKTPEKKEAKKAPAKKSEAKPAPKKAPKKSEKAAPKSAPKKAEKPKGFTFPKSFSDDDGVKYTVADDIVTIDAMRKAIENDEDITIATRWTKEDLKKFTYAQDYVTKPKKFDNDMDLLTVVYVGDREDVIYTVSMFTEASFVFFGKNLKPTKNGRVALNLPFEVYHTSEK